MSGRPWYMLKPCGSDSVYHRHARRGELKDIACQEAHAAAEAWRQKRRRGEAVTGAEAHAAHLRRMHARFTALRKDGVALADMPALVAGGERAYQRESKQRRRQERAQQAGILTRLRREEALRAGRQREVAA